MTNWKKYKQAKQDGTVQDINTPDLKNLVSTMDEAAALLNEFPEAESTRDWLRLKSNEIHSVLVDRKAYRRLPVFGSGHGESKTDIMLKVAKEQGIAVKHIKMSSKE